VHFDKGHSGSKDRWCDFDNVVLVGQILTKLGQDRGSIGYGKRSAAPAAGDG
jgi:hypothetical protein